MTDERTTKEAHDIGYGEGILYTLDLYKKRKELGTDTETKHGHWVHEFPNVGHLTHYYLCSVCRTEWNAIDNEMERFDYCPSCGARMDEPDE